MLLATVAGVTAGLNWSFPNMEHSDMTNLGETTVVSQRRPSSKVPYQAEVLDEGEVEGRELEHRGL